MSTIVFNLYLQKVINCVPLEKFDSGALIFSFKGEISLRIAEGEKRRPEMRLLFAG